MQGTKMKGQIPLWTELVQFQYQAKFWSVQTQEDHCSSEHYNWLSKELFSGKAD